jgi:hypothetical protein
VYAREFDGRTLTFGVSGKLITNALVMYDRETDSLWSQFLGVAVRGEFEGTRMQPLAAMLTDWATWRQLHPDTLVLDQGGKRVDPYSGYYEDTGAGVLSKRFDDDRLADKEFVLGVDLTAGTKAYPFRHLSERPVVNDTVGELDLLIVFDRDSATGVVWDRHVEGRTLTFEPAEPRPGVPMPLVDRETGTLWGGLTGEALEGELAGARLRRVHATQVFWFAWNDFHPDAPLWTPSETGPQ